MQKVQISLIVFRMEFDLTRWSCPWNSDQTVHKILPRGGIGKGNRGGWGSRGGGSQG